MFFSTFNNYISDTEIFVARRESMLNTISFTPSTQSVFCIKMVKSSTCYFYLLINLLWFILKTQSIKDLSDKCVYLCGNIHSVFTTGLWHEHNIYHSWGKWTLYIYYSCDMDTVSSTVQSVKIGQIQLMQFNMNKVFS